MSAPATTSVQNPSKSDSDRLARPVGAAAADSLPPDPLLRSGSFIDASTTATDGNGGSPFDDRKARKFPPQTPEPRRSSGATPAPNPDSSDRVKRKPAEAELDWLPPGWTVEDRVRISGVSAGTKDRYYFDPVSGCKFRSKKEVLYFLETGSRRKRKPTENPDADATPVDSSGEQKQNSSASKKGSALNFNFSRVPDKVQWVLADSSGESWNAFVDGKQVPESSKLDWLAAFTLLASKDRGRYH